MKRIFALILFLLIGVSSVWADPFDELNRMIWQLPLSNPTQLAVTPFISTFNKREIVYSTRFFDVYRTGAFQGRGASYQYYQRLSYAHPLSFNSYSHFRLIAESQKNVYQHSISNSEFYAEDKWQSATISMAMQTLPWCIVNTGVTIKKESPPLPSLKLAILSNVVDAAILWKKDQENFKTYSYVELNPVNIQLNTHSETHGGSFTYSYRGWEGWGCYAKTMWFKKDSLPKTPEFQPNGYQQTFEGAVQYNFPLTYIGINGFSRYGKTMAYGYQGEWDFSKLTRMDWHVNGVSVMGEKHLFNGYLLEGSLSYSHWSGYLRGHLEFWPFTSGLIDLLGSRRYFIAHTQGKLFQYQLSVHTQSKSNPFWSNQISTIFLDGYPKGLLNHWKPVFLVFGKDDEQFVPLTIERAQFLKLSNEYRRSYSSMEVNISISQLIPIRTTHTQPQQVSEEPASPTQKKKVYGGGELMISLRYRF